MTMVPIVTFDVFSALTDSHAGGSAFLQSVADARGWPVSGAQLYEHWDSLNKGSHRLVREWVPFAQLSESALRAALSALALPVDDAGQLSQALLESMADWPLWPDVSDSSLAALGADAIGLLSNIDDDLLAATAAMRLNVVDRSLVVTSQRAQAYKPSPALYHRAGDLLGPFVHVASSARDVSGAVSAGISCVRLARPGHPLDASGPAPTWTADSIGGLRPLLAAAFHAEGDGPGGEPS